MQKSSDSADWKCNPEDQATFLQIRNFVCEKDPSIALLTREAVTDLETASQGKYQSFTNAVHDGSNGVMMALYAIYHRLKQKDIVYEDVKSFRWKTGQSIRCPGEVLSSRKGTCIDLALLFLGCLAEIQLRPIYVQLLISRDEGHALAAVWVDEEFDQDLFLECDDFCDYLEREKVVVIEATGYATGYPDREKPLDFQQALQRGKELAMTGCSDTRQDERHSFLFALDIRRAWHQVQENPAWCRACSEKNLLKDTGSRTWLGLSSRTWLGLSVVAVLVALLAIWLLTREHCWPPFKPTIDLTNVPRYASETDLRGVAKCIDPANYRIVVYIQVDGQWWSKPTAADHLIPLARDGTWSADVTTAPNDKLATAIKAYLLPKKYDPPVVLGDRVIPAEVIDQAVDYAEVTREMP